MDLPLASLPTIADRAIAFPVGDTITVAGVFGGAEVVTMTEEQNLC